MPTIAWIILGIGFLVAVIGGIFFFIDYAKERKNKLSSMLMGAGLVIILIGGLTGFSVNAHNKQVESARLAKEKKENEEKDHNFVRAATSFYSTLSDTDDKIVNLGNKEYDYWGDAIDNSGDDFDVDKTIEDMSDKYSDKALAISENVDSASSDLKKMEKNDTNHFNIKPFKTAYKQFSLKADFVEYPDGSYDDFIDTLNGYNDKIKSSDSDMAEQLEKMTDINE